MANKFKSLIFPALNTMIFLIIILVHTIGSNHFDEVIEVIILMPCTILFGGITGGILPLTIAIIYKTDISDHFIHQLIILAISVAVCFLSWLDISGSLFIAAPIMWEIISVIFWIEKYFREVGSLSVQKILVLSLSNPLMLYIGIVVDTMNSFFINIPG